MPKHVFPELRKPQGAGHAGHPREAVAAVHRIERKKPSQRVPGDADVRRASPDFFPGCRHDFRRQCLQIGIRSSRSSRTPLRQRRTTPRRHIVIPLKLSDHQQIAVRRIHRPHRLRKLFPVSHHRIENDQWPVFSLRRIQRKLLFTYLKSDLLHFVTIHQSAL